MNMFPHSADWARGRKEQEEAHGSGLGLEPILLVTLCLGIELQYALEFKMLTWPCKVIMKLDFIGGWIKHVLLSVYYLNL